MWVSHEPLRTSSWKAIAIALTVTSIACSGGGGGGGAPSIDDGGGTDPGTSNPGTTATPAFDGFTLEVEEGAFWDFAWSEVESTFAPGISESEETRGRYRITLGEKTRRAGRDVFEVLFSGRPQRDPQVRWRYLAFEEDAILGSEDGIEFTVLFDGSNGYWAGSGLIARFDSDILQIAENGTLNNEFRVGPAVMTQHSTSSGQCEVILGQVFCGSNVSTSFSTIEYWAPGIGPVGYYRSGGVSSQTGSSSSVTEHGLIDFSLSAALPDDDLEIEPNDRPLDAQPMDLDRVVVGSVDSEEPGFVPNSPELFGTFPGVPVSQFAFQDWYEIVIPFFGTYDFELSFPEDPITDLDLFVFADDARDLVGLSADDNIGTTRQTVERVSATMSAGTYLIAVWGFDTRDGVQNYELEVSRSQ